jgi:hypothetical protein
LQRVNQDNPWTSQGRIPREIGISKGLTKIYIHLVSTRWTRTRTELDLEGIASILRALVSFLGLALGADPGGASYPTTFLHGDHNLKNEGYVQDECRRGFGFRGGVEDEEETWESVSLSANMNRTAY